MVKTDDLQLIVELADQALPRDLHRPEIEVALRLHHPLGYGSAGNYYLRRDYCDSVWINDLARMRPSLWAEV